MNVYTTSQDNEGSIFTWSLSWLYVYNYIYGYRSMGISAFAVNKMTRNETLEWFYLGLVIIFYFPPLIVGVAEFIYRKKNG